MSQAIDFEELVINALLESRGVSFRDVQLEPDDFDSPWFRQAYGVMQAVYADKGLLDVWLVLERIGDPVVRQRVLDALQIPAVVAHLPFYVSKVVEQSVSRQLVQIALESQAGDGQSVQDRIDTLRVKLDALKVVQAVEMPDLAWDLQVMLNDVLSPKALIKTCFAGLNNLIVGLKQSRLYVFGARPGVGKTVVGLQLAWEIARSQDVLFFSLEMDKTDLLKRVVAGELDIDLSLLERGDLTADQRLRVGELIRTVENKLIVADKGGQTVSQLRSYLVAVKAKRNVEVVVVDYLQLIQASNPKASAYEKVSQISIELKNMAKEFNVAVVALAQLNRRVDNKPDDKPNASDLRDSGQIEQDADVIVMLSRKQSEMDVARDTEILKGLHPDRLSFGAKSLLVMDVVKNRHGAVGMFDSLFDGSRSRIRELPSAR
jgi:replicative DNA helicase